MGELLGATPGALLAGLLGGFVLGRLHHRWHRGRIRLKLRTTAQLEKERELLVHELVNIDNALQGRRRQRR
jgi:hypothetical protein